MSNHQAPHSNQQYQCPDCLWTGTTMDMGLEGNVLFCPTCHTAFSGSWEKWDETY